MIRARIFGHRGVAARAPENTLAGLRLAFDEGAHGVEFDVRATHDDALVLLHDATVDRTTSGRGILRDLTLEQVRALDAGASFAPQFQGERIPTLDEVLDEFLGRIALDIEVKEILPQTRFARSVHAPRKRKAPKCSRPRSFAMSCISCAT